MCGTQTLTHLFPLPFIPVNSGGSVIPWHSSLAIGLLTSGSVLAVAFLFIEWKLARLPMMPLHLFSSLSKATLFGQNFLFGFVWQADLYFLPIYYQDVCGYTPIKSAYLSLPLLLAQSLAGVLSGPTMTLTARYMPTLWIGFILWTLGAGLKLLFTRSTSVPVYVVVALIEGAGVGFVFQPSLVALQALSTKAELAVTTSTRNWVRALGSAVGVAASTAVQFAIMSRSLPAGLPSSVASAVRDGTWKAGDSPRWDDAIIDAKMKGIHSVFIVFVPLIGFCLLGCIWIRDIVLKGDNDNEGEKTNGRLISKLWALKRS
ncbi:hypothetical protein VTK73DRAFT_6238 [Phialemonium thermophilum]|uniref:Major facilitator superfamily (MFS) profile domain-containing protein n=1 Tax=Phialemonium thermophilum TaxID=223376 RepID=A0ABR3WKP9_9PEZI